MSKHTPGPWTWEDNDGFGYSLSPGILLTDYTDGTPWGDELDKANARLIAAAPEMLEALKAALETIGLHEYPATGRLIAAAIAKAEGQS